MYSQNNEEEVILNHFKNFKCTFLDLGAYDGIDLSNPKHESEVYVILNDKDEVRSYRATNFTPIDIIREIVIDDILK